MLTELGMATRIDVNTRNHYGSPESASISPVEAIAFFKRKFSPGNQVTYFEAKYQVFSGSQKEKHYLDLASGDLSDSWAIVPIKSNAWDKMRANLVYLVTKKDTREKKN